MQLYPAGEHYLAVQGSAVRAGPLRRIKAGIFMSARKVIPEFSVSMITKGGLNSAIQNLAVEYA